VSFADFGVEEGYEDALGKWRQAPPETCRARRRSEHGTFVRYDFEEFLAIPCV